MKKYFSSPFDIDASLNGGYLYTTQARLSSIVANHRLTLAILNAVRLSGKKVIDIGCGDGVYTFELYRNARPKKLYGVDSAIKSIGQIASEILILEPNGYNPLLKIIEKISPYHRFHKEKSYTPKMIRGWLHKAGFTVYMQKYISIIPFFFPDTFTVILKPFEPFVE